MDTTVYLYERCGTCRKATNWLDERGIQVRVEPIRERPPSVDELRLVLRSYDGELKRLFNTSSKDYREAGLKDRIADMDEREAFRLLRANGNLIKRPCVVGPDRGLVGFRPAEWSAFFGVE